ncbi:MAG: hypothetical protein CM1200mP14_22870 [Gammaproteobacteria bacterium]|nr:MAG: hypothetical protein CM1200mP14_22870 [Gammaproteobacteria bacterium]
MLFASDSIGADRPHLYPGERTVFQTSGGAGGSSVLLLDRQTGGLKTIAPAGNQPRYVETGHIVFGHGDQALMAIPFDLESLEVTGNQSTVLPMMTVFSGGASQYGFSETGTLIYAAAGQLGGGMGRQLAMVDLAGNETPLPLPARPT